MGIQSEIRDHLLSQPPSFKKKKEYVLLELLGRGGFGKVVKATWSPPGREKEDVALKIVPKNRQTYDREAVLSEIKVLEGLDHPHIVHLWDHFESRDKHYINFELATGGELFDRITRRGKFTEKDAADCIRQVLTAITYVHSKGIVHRDIKPENLLFRTPDPHSPIVIADFGIAKYLDQPAEAESSTTSTAPAKVNVQAAAHASGGHDYEDDEGEEGVESVAGSLGYAAPEVLAGKKHGGKVDCWSIGVIAYSLLCGYQPFRAETKAELVREMMRGKVNFHDRYWKKVSETAKDFCRGMLQVDPRKRLSSAEALAHPWMTSGQTSEYDLSSNIKANFNPRAKFTAAVHAVNASNRLRSLPPSRSGSYASTSTASTSSPTSLSAPAPFPTTGGSTATAPKGQSTSRKSSLNTTLTPLSGTDDEVDPVPATPRQVTHDAEEEDEDGFVTADEEPDDGEGNAKVGKRDFAKERDRPGEGTEGTLNSEDSTGRGAETGSAGYGLKGLMGRLRL